ncbi:hypothetical protein [Shewanella sp.]|uniref:hypothetical protein n=1 Tax=Shewanella sp. TaxID=50422 RepID=UPI003F40F936
MKSNFAVATLFIVGSWLQSGCTKTPEWTLFYYPDADAAPTIPLQVDDIHGYYDTLEQCQRKAQGMKRLSGSSVSHLGLGGYQCGQLCELDDASRLSCKTLSQ